MSELLASADGEKLLPTTLSLLKLSSLEQENDTGLWAAALLRQAQQRHPADFWINHDLAQLLRDAQPPQLEEAIGYYRAAVALRPQSPGAHNNLSSALSVKGRLDEAIAECREAIRLKKDFALAHCNLGNALAYKGQLDEGIAECREAIRLKKDFALAHCNLGAALHAKGQLDEGIAEYREAIRIKKDYAEAHNKLNLALAQRDALAKVPEILSGKAKPTNTAECLALAMLCQLDKQWHAASVRFYCEAFTCEPKLADDLNAQRRYNAACAAALAGCGQGKDADKLDGKERARLRQQALDWLRADLKAYRQVIEKSAAKDGPEIAERMQHLLQDKDFTGVRGAESLGKLPKAEHKEWHKLWEEVEELRQRAARPPKTENAAQP